MADLCLWKPGFFGVRPEVVIKDGFIVWGAMGDANASIPTPGPVWGRPMFGSFGQAAVKLGRHFLSPAAMELGVPDQLGLRRPSIGTIDVRSLKKTDLPLNGALPVIEVNPETYEVRADGNILACEPLDILPLAQRYFLF
jgi:urease subunit alpha